MAEPVSKFLFTPIPADVIIQLSQAIRNNDSAALAAVFTTKHLISNGTPTSDSHVRSRETTPRESGSLSRSRSEDGPNVHSVTAKVSNASKGQLMLLFHAPLCAEQDTALLFGVRHSSLDAVRFLLDCGADVLEQHSVTGDSALHIAAKIGDVDMVKLLLNRDGDVTARNHEGKTPMEVIHPAKQSILKPMFSQAITERSTSLPSLSHLRNSAVGSPNKPITNISPSPPLTRSPRSAFSPVVRKSIHSPSRLNIETNASSTSSHASVSSIPVAQDNILPAAARDSFSTPSFLSGVIASPPSAQAGSPGRAVPVLARFSPPSISPRITGANQTPTAPQSEISPTTNATASSAWQTRSSQGLSSSFQDRLFISPVPTSPHHTHGISDPTQNATSSAFQRPRYVSMPEFQDFTSVGRSESNQSLHLSDGDRQPKQPVPAHHHHALSAYDTTSSNSFNSGQHSAQSSPGGTMPRGRSTHNIVTSNVKMLESVQGSPGTAAIASPARPSATTDLTYLPPLRSIKPRHLWVADGLRSACFRCHRGFSFFFRRHHCRVCGEVVCDNCSLGRLPYLFAFADAFIETGIPSSSYVPELPYSACTEMVRVCDGCVSARRADFEVRCQGLAAPVL